MPAYRCSRAFLPAAAVRIEVLSVTAERNKVVPRKASLDSFIESEGAFFRLLIADFSHHILAFQGPRPSGHTYCSHQHISSNTYCAVSWRHIASPQNYEKRWFVMDDGISGITNAIINRNILSAPSELPGNHG